MKLRALGFTITITRATFLQETEEYATKLLEKTRFNLAHQNNLLANHNDKFNEHQITGIENAIKQAETDIINYESQLEVIANLK